MPQRVLSEGEFNAIKDSLLRQAPDGLDESGFQRWFTPRFDGALAEAEQSPEPVSGGSLRRFLSNAGEMLNPITMAQGVYQAARHPLDTGQAILQAQGAQFDKAAQAFQQGRMVEGAGYGMAGIVPIIGPLAAETGEQIASGDVAGGAGKAAGILAPIGAVQAARTARATIPAGTRARVASSLERGAAERVTDVMAPTVGPNKVRFGNQADRVAPDVARTLASEGAPLTREGLHTTVQTKLAEAEAALEAASQARNPNAVIHTRPILRDLEQRKAQVTA